MNGKRFFEQYRNKLSADQIATGVNIAIDNSLRLLRDAELLLRERRYPSAYALAILAAEEVGKIEILQRIGFVDDSNIKDEWRAYRNHSMKNWKLLLPIMTNAGLELRQAMAVAADPESSHRHIFEEIKQLSLYSDCLLDGESLRWSNPKDEIGESEARSVVAGTKSLAGAAQKKTAEEIELKIKHFAPVSGASADAQRRAFKAYIEEARDLGFEEITEKDLECLLGEER